MPQYKRLDQCIWTTRDGARILVWIYEQRGKDSYEVTVDKVLQNVKYRYQSGMILFAPVSELVPLNDMTEALYL